MTGHPAVMGRSMRKYFAYTAISVASRLVVNALLFVVLARLWGPEGFGVFAFVLSTCALVMLIADFGFPTFLLREVAAYASRASELIGQGLRLKACLTLAMVLVSIMVAVGLGPHALPVDLFCPLLISTLLLSFAEYFAAPLRAIGRYDLEALLASTGNTAQFILAGGIAWAGGTTVEVAWAILVARLLYAIASIRVLKGSVPRVSLWQSSGSIRETWRIVWPYGIDAALTSVWSYVDVLAIRLLFGVHAVGLYAAGQKIVQGVVGLAPVVGNVMIPRLAYETQSRGHYTWRTGGLTAALMIGIGVAFAFPLIAFPSAITTSIFGTGYSQLSHWLPWFGAILLVRYVGAGFGTVLSAIGLQKRRMVGQIAAIAVYMVSMAVVAWAGMGIDMALCALFIAMSVMGCVYLLCLRRTAVFEGQRHPGNRYLRLLAVLLGSGVRDAGVGATPKDDR